MFGVLLGLEIIQGSFKFELENVISCTYPVGTEGGPVRTLIERLKIGELPIFLAEIKYSIHKDLPIPGTPVNKVAERSS